MFRSIFKFLASLKLALLLLAVIIVASILGTIYESGFNADVAKKYIYNAPWFNVWLGMLCVNLFAVAAIRYPWKPHQTGFVITHAGIIILLIGGMIDRQYGIEGMIRLNRGQPPTNVLELFDSDLTVRVGEKSAKTRVLTKSLLYPSEFKIDVASPSPDVKVEIIDKFPPLVQLVLQGPQMGRHELWMFLNSQEDLGPASLIFRQGVPPEPKPKKAPKQTQAQRRERYFVFSKQEGQIGRVIVGEAVGVKSKLVVDAEGKSPKLKLELLGKTFDLDVNSNLQKTLPLEGLADWSVYIPDYYPNFRMNGGQPGNLNDKPENPAVFFELIGPTITVTESDSEDAHQGMRGGGSSLSLYLGPDGKLRYFMKTRSKGESAGEVELEKAIPAWAPGSEFVVQKYFPNGLTQMMMDNADQLKGANFKALNERNGGLLLRVSAKGESRDVWVSESLPTDPNFIKVEVGGQSVELGLPHCAVELPFTVSLERFVARQQEGRDGMRDYETYESTLSFNAGQKKEVDSVRLKPDAPSLQQIGKDRLNEKGELTCSIIDMDETSLTLDFFDLPSSNSSIVVPKSEIADFTKRTHKISMNRPTTYPETWYGPWTGVNYKFSQAGMDADMPDYSGVQVLRDPGWAPKWIGCLMICFGIFTMFYLKPYFHGRREVKAAEAAVKSNSKSEPKKSRSAENLAAGD